MIPLPEPFVAQHSAALCGALDAPQDEPTSVRINPLKPLVHPWTDRVPWWEGGFYLDGRPQFSLDPTFWAGGYYVQEAGSMFVGWLLDRLELPLGAKVLDLCASPGGKTTQIASLIGRQGVLVSNEVIRNRVGALVQNVQKWGVGNTVVTSVDASSFGALGGVFDVLVVDAPCSGEGMMRKDQAARREWSVEGVAQCAARQRRIVADAWDSLVEGGVLLYSTCTFNSSENEENVRWIADELGGQVVDCSDSVLPEGVEANAVAGYNFYPHLARTEGFYVAVVRKTSSAPWSGEARRKRARVEDRWTVGALEATEQGELLYGYTEGVADMVARLQAKRLYMTYAGVELGKEFKGALRPAHGLALAADVRVGVWPDAELSVVEALDYLRCGVVDPSGLVEGINRITYGGLGLGFAKRIGGRVNNMFPTGWRLLKGSGGNVIC